MTWSPRCPGVEVTGARCDGTGKIINRGSLTAVQGGDGSAALTNGDRSLNVNGDGSGNLVDGERTITVDGDGTGNYVDGQRTITINRDGSGNYVDGERTVSVDGKGSGSYTDGQQTISIGSDGSGSYTDGEISITNNGDGSGSYVDSTHSVVNNGNGTGLVDGATVAMAPLAPVPPVGRFPGVGALGPVGTACGTLIRLSERVLFDFDQALLRPEAEPVLDRLAGALGSVNGPLAVNGHTDAKGEDAYNIDLSDRRAAAVVAGLKQRGVGQELVASGFGESPADRDQRAQRSGRSRRPTAEPTCRDHHP